MHEITIVKNIVDSTESFARENGISHIDVLVLQIGDLTGIIPKYVRMYYPEVTEGTVLDNSEVEIEQIPAEFFCRNCGCTFTPEGPDEHCPDCGELDHEVLHGQEITIKEIKQKDE